MKLEMLAEYGWKPHRVCLAQKRPIAGRKLLVYLYVNDRGVRFHRIRDLKQYTDYYNGIPPTSQRCAPPGPSTDAVSKADT